MHGLKVRGITSAKIKRIWRSPFPLHLLKQIVHRFTGRQRREHLADERVRTALNARKSRVSVARDVHACFPRVESNLNKHTGTRIFTVQSTSFVPCVPIDSSFIKTHVNPTPRYPYAKSKSRTNACVTLHNFILC